MKNKVTFGTMAKRTETRISSQATNCSRRSDFLGSQQGGELYVHNSYIIVNIMNYPFIQLNSLLRVMQDDNT